MTADGGVQSGWIYTHTWVATIALAVSLPCQAGQGSSAASQPLPSDACRAWYIHIAEMIDQHRMSNELDDGQFGEIVRLFYEAQSACAAEHFTEGLAIYEVIPVQPVRGKPLR
jgi:hypothetical protein